jgi:hypothetical protein
MPRIISSEEGEALIIAKYFILPFIPYSVTLPEKRSLYDIRDNGRSMHKGDVDQIQSCFERRMLCVDYINLKNSGYYMYHQLQY